MLAFLRPFFAANCIFSLDVTFFTESFWGCHGTKTPEYREETTHHDWRDDTSVSIVLPKGLPGKYGATILMVSNLKYFLV